MSTTYRETLTEHQCIEVEVIVEDAESEEQAREIATLFADFEEGTYHAASTLQGAGMATMDGNPIVTINRTVQDSDTEENDDGEWEDDDASD